MIDTGEEKDAAVKFRHNKRRKTNKIQFTGRVL